MNLFTYGTLMDEGVISALLGRHPTFRKAILHGYARRPVKNACYPALLPSEEARTAGIVYRDLQDQDWRVLDWFEDDLYLRESVTAELDNGESIPVQAYVVNPDRLSDLDLNQDWSFKEFKQTHYREYFEMCRQALSHFRQQHPGT